MSGAAPLSPVVNPTVVLRRWPEVVGFLPRLAALPTDVPRVLGVDLSHRRTGLCAILPDGVRVNSEKLTVRGWSVGADMKKGAPIDLRWERMHLIAEDIRGAIWTYRITHIAIEGPAFGLGMGMHLLGELSGVVKEAIFTRAAPRPVVEVVPPMQARKMLLGRATTGKIPVQQYVRERWGIELPPDEADAFAVANWMWTRLASWGFGPTQMELAAIADALKVEKQKVRR